MQHGTPQAGGAASTAAKHASDTEFRAEGSSLSTLIVKPATRYWTQPGGKADAGATLMSGGVAGPRASSAWHVSILPLQL
jgi:hypothetical protein